MIQINPTTVPFEQEQGTKFIARVLTYDSDATTGQCYWAILSDKNAILKEKNATLDEVEFDALKKGTLDVEDLLLSNLGLERAPSDSLTEEEELALKALLYEKKVIAVYTELMKKSLEFSMDKQGSLEYLKLQKQEYQEKYQLAKAFVTDNNAVVDEDLKTTMTKEIESDFTEAALDTILTAYNVTPTGTHFNKMCQLVVFRYEYGLMKYQKFNAFAIFFRAKSRTLIEQSEWVKIDSGIVLANEIQITISLEELSEKYNDFDLI